jgi:hypothetical protein
MNRFSRLLHPLSLDARIVAALSEPKREKLMQSKEFRLLTRDRTMDPHEWTDSTGGKSYTHNFPTRGHLHTFVNKLQAEGWQIIYSTGQPQTVHLFTDPAQEFWIFRRPIDDYSPNFP